MTVFAACVFLFGAAVGAGLGVIAMAAAYAVHESSHGMEEE